MPSLMRLAPHFMLIALVLGGMKYASGTDGFGPSRQTAVPFDLEDLEPGEPVATSIEGPDQG